MMNIAVILLFMVSRALAQFAAQTDDALALERVTLDGMVVGQGVRMQVVEPGWRGAWAVQRPADLKGAVSDEGGRRKLSGLLDCDGHPIAIEVVLETGSADNPFCKLWYRLTPTENLDTELVVVFVDLPVAGNAGQGEFLVSDGSTLRTHPLPTELPSPYHIASALDIDWCGWILPGDVGLRIEPDGVAITGVSFQDNRQFGGDVFQAQFAVNSTRGLRVGQTYEFGLTLRPLRRADVERERQHLASLPRPSEQIFSSDKPLALRAITFSTRQIRAYEKLELTLDLDGTFDNPFDPDDIDVMATFTGPSGQVQRVPGFYYQDYQWVERRGRYRLYPLGEPGWRVRFAPAEVGIWQVVISVRDRSGEVISEPERFECTTGSRPGFVRRSPYSPYYLCFDNGDPYFAVGLNLCWASDDIRRYRDWLWALGAAGGNYCRIWLVHWNMGLEWTDTGAEDVHYHGLGRYSLDNAYRLDWVMEQARANGVYCMLCLGFHGELMDTRGYFGEDCWGANPYNAANGGPCAKPADFWTSDQARKLYRQRLRYTIARYGWDTHVLSWEFWNEVFAPAPWVQEMARYLKANDPYQHLVTTTWGTDEVWRIPELDYTQAHTYGSGEDRPVTVPHIAALGREYTSQWPKPFMIGEFGVDWKTSDRFHDPEGKGTNLHDGLWASLMTRCFGAAALWYWDDYVHPFNLYRELTPIRRFVEDVPFPSLNPDFARFEAATVPVPPDTPWGDVTLTPQYRWERNRHTDITVNPDGTITPDSEITRILFSDSKPDLKSPLRFHVTCPQGGALRFRVETVSVSAKLHVRIDGTEVWTRELLAGPGEGEWVSTEYRPEWGIWQSRYDLELEVPIPPGRHVVEMENKGDDWVDVTRYVFVGCRDPRFPPIDLLGLCTEDYALLWVHDERCNWFNDKYGSAPTQVTGATSALLGLRDGPYRIEWWDTRTGEVATVVKAWSRDGRLPLEIPTFVRDVAAKVTWEGE